MQKPKVDIVSAYLRKNKDAMGLRWNEGGVIDRI